MGSGCTSLKKKKEKKSENPSIKEKRADDGQGMMDHKANKEITAKVDEHQNVELKDVIVPQIILPQDMPEMHNSNQISGKWYFKEGEKDKLFDDRTQKLIENDNILGKLKSEFIFEGREWVLDFKNNVMYSGNIRVNVKRISLVKIEYRWENDDGTLRPCCVELDKMLRETDQKLFCTVGGQPYEVDILNNTYKDINNQTVRVLKRFEDP